MNLKYLVKKRKRRKNVKIFAVSGKGTNSRYLLIYNIIQDIFATFNGPRNKVRTATL